MIYILHHTARRRVATNSYLEGVPTISSMKITAHNRKKLFAVHHDFAGGHRKEVDGSPLLYLSNGLNLCLEGTLRQFDICLGTQTDHRAFQERSMQYLIANNVLVFP